LLFGFIHIEGQVSEIYLVAKVIDKVCTFGFDRPGRSSCKRLRSISSLGMDISEGSFLSKFSGAFVDIVVTGSIVLLYFSTSGWLAGSVTVSLE
jgi:hypothetical protein